MNGDCHQHITGPRSGSSRAGATAAPHGRREVYAAYALGARLTVRRIHRRARTFAKWSSLFSLTLGWGDQVAYHLLASRGAEQAPWQVVVAVSGIPVLVLAFGAGLAHLQGVPHKRKRRPAVAATAPHQDIPVPNATSVAATLPVAAEELAPVVVSLAPAEPASRAEMPNLAPLPAPVMVAAGAREVVTGRVPVVYPEGISERNRQIPALATRAHSQRAIAERLGVGSGTVGRVWDEHRAFLAEHGVQLRRREDSGAATSASRLHEAPALLPG